MDNKLGKVIYIDTETTGLIPGRHDIVQLAAIIEINGEVVQKINLKCQPFNWDTIEDKALEVTGNTVEEMKTWQSPQDAYRKFIATMDKYIDKWNKNDKLIPIGQNIPFDLSHLREWFKKCDPKEGKYMGSYIDYHSVDILSITALMKVAGKINPARMKLADVANYFGIQFDAHDALADIEMTREIFLKYIDIVKGVQSLKSSKCDICKRESMGLRAIPIEFETYKGDIDICQVCYNSIHGS